MRKDLDTPSKEKIIDTDFLIPLDRLLVYGTLIIRRTI